MRANASRRRLHAAACGARIEVLESKTLLSIPPAPSFAPDYQQVWAQDFASMTSLSELNAVGGYTMGTGTWISHTPLARDWFTFKDPAGDLNPFGVGNGYLDIRVQQNGDPTKFGGFTGGLLSSMDRNQVGFAQQYGYFEVSMQTPGGPNTWPAFWLMSTDYLLNPSLSHAELDVTESYGNRNCGPNYNPPGDPDTSTGAWHQWLAGGGQNTNYSRVLVSGATTGYHTYGVDVEPTGITWYVDRQAYWTSPIFTEANEPLYILLDLALGGGNYNNYNGTAYDWSLTNNPSDLKVQYVAVWASPNSPNYVPNTSLAQYNLNDAGTTDANDATPITNLAVSALTQSGNNGWLHDDDTSKFIANSADNETWYATGSALANLSRNTGRYFQFTLPPGAGASIDLESLALSMGVSRTSTGSGSLPWSVDVYWSLDGYTSSLGTITEPNTEGAQLMPTFTLRSLDLSGITGSQGITAPVTFELFPYDGNGSTATTKFAVLDTFSLTGSVTQTPPPPAAALAQYNLNDAGTTDANDATSISGLTVSTLTQSGTNGWLHDDDTSKFITNSADNETWYATGSALSNLSRNTGKYFQFTLTPTGGTSINLESLALSMGVSRTSTGSGSLPWSVDAYWSLDGYTTSLGTITEPNTEGAQLTPTFTLRSLDLSGITGSQGITSPVTLELFPYDGNGSTATTKFAVLDTLSLTGSVSSGLAAAGPALVDGNAASLTQQQLIPVVSAAELLWKRAGAAPSIFVDLEIRIEDLPGNLLGEQYGNTIVMDVDAAGYGWWTSLTHPEANKMDLLTAVSHELGHVLGLRHLDAASEPVMADTLASGQRELPMPLVEPSFATWISPAGKMKGRDIALSPTSAIFNDSRVLHSIPWDELRLL